MVMSGCVVFFPDAAVVAGGGGGGAGGDGGGSGGDGYGAFPRRSLAARGHGFWTVTRSETS